jgi:hypothetical protein
MTIKRTSPAVLRRFGLLIIMLALLGSNTLLQARAMDADKAESSSLFAISACEAAGGHAEVIGSYTASGVYLVTVICHGGLLDGLGCQYGNTDYSINGCWWAWRVKSADIVTHVTAGEIAPLDEPTAQAPVVDTGEVVVDTVQSEPVDVDQATPEPTLTATPDPTVVSGDQPVDASGQTDATPVDGGAPVVDNGAVGDTTVIQEPTEGPTVISDPLPGLHHLPDINVTSPMVEPVVAPAP